MSRSISRQLVPVLVAFAVAAAGLLIPASALAQQALFRIQQAWHGFPNPGVTPGGAGLYQGYVVPYYLPDAVGKPGLYVYPPATAGVAPGNPVGGAFTLPAAFLDVYSTGTLTPKTAWPGYTTTYYYHAYNGPGDFAPGRGPTATYRMVFPTTLGNPSPTFMYDPVLGRSHWFGGNYGTGNPVNPTTTFDGRYDKSRAGSIVVEPGPNRFGGTWRLFFYDTAKWIQNIFYSPPQYYYGYGSYFCFDDGVKGCTPYTHVSEPGTTQIYNGTWWLLTDRAASPAKAAGMKAVVPVPAPRYSTYPTPTPLGSYSYLRRSQHYLNLIHPWTTGYARVVNAPGEEGTGIITPQGEGYDITFDPAVTFSVKKFNWNENFNETLNTFTTTTTTPYTQVLTNVTRVVSMVRPRLVWTMSVTLDPTTDPIENIWNPLRMRKLKVFFLPEPAGMVMLGAGIAALLGLARMRRR
jgi:hypothetical protein